MKKLMDERRRMFSEIDQAGDNVIKIFEDAGVDNEYYRITKCEWARKGFAKEEYQKRKALKEKYKRENPEYYKNNEESKIFIDSIRLITSKFVNTTQINPWENADRLIHYNLEELEQVINDEELGGEVIDDFNNMGDRNKYYNKLLKDTIPDKLVLGTDIAATLAMSFPIPYILEHYIMNAREYYITGEELDASILSTSVTKYDKRQYDSNLACACSLGGYDLVLDNKQYATRNIYAKNILKSYYENKTSWTSNNPHNAAMKQLAKALINESAVLTTQFIKPRYREIHQLFDAGDLPILPLKKDLVRYYKDKPLHKSKRHLEQTEKILTHLENKNILFNSVERLNYFPLNKDQIEDYVPIEEYCKR